MFVQDTLQKIGLVSGPNSANTKFILMFVGVVIGPFALLVVGGRTPATFWQVGLVWTLLSIGLLFLISASAGLMMFRSKSYAHTPPSICPLNKA